MDNIPNEDKEIKTMDDLVLIHLTNYLPQNGIIKTPKSANVEAEEKFMGVSYKIGRKRDTIHFTLNGEVENNTGGSWDDIKYAIIIPLKKIPKDKIIGGIPVDIYSNGDVEIPEGSYILCPDKEKEEVKDKIGENISVVGIEDDFIKGYANEFIEKIGYKKEKNGFWNWENKKDNEIVTKIILENGWSNSPHSVSHEMKTELFEEDIERTIVLMKIIKQGKIKENFEEVILNNHNTSMGTGFKILSDNVLMKHFYEAAEKIGVLIPNNVLEEIELIEKGNISSQILEEASKSREEIKYGYYSPDTIAEWILRRRIVGELRLSQIKDNIENFKKENQVINFENLLEFYDEVLYEYTTLDRRKNFFKSLDIDLSDLEFSILEDKELRKKYLEISTIKDESYSKLTEEDKEKYNRVIKYIGENGFKEFQISRESQFDEKTGKEITCNARIYKKNFEEFSKNEIEVLNEKMKNNKVNRVIVLKDEIWNEDTSISDYFKKCKMIYQDISELLNIEDKQQIVSTEMLGKETIKQQNNSDAKEKMQNRINLLLKKYILEQEGKQI